MKRLPSPSTDSTEAKKPKITPPVSDSEGWTRIEKRKDKKAKKVAQKADAAIPRFMYSNADIQKRNYAISIDDIRDLVLHILADAPPPNWIQIENKKAIQKVVVLLVPGLTPDILNLPPFPTSAIQNPNLPLPIPLPTQNGETSVAFIAKTFSHACPTRAPGEQTRMHSVLSSFFSAPVSGEEKKKRVAARLLSERNLDKKPERYVLSLPDMIENDYPIPSYLADVSERPDGWVETPQPIFGAFSKTNSGSTAGKKAQLYAIDCEMCLTEDGKELTRVCVIDYYTEKVVYDSLVKPSKPIIDYLTKWSGITPEALESTSTTLPTVQAHILALLSPSSEPADTPTPILIGHSLESDLRALRLAHPYCIDTALLYHHPRGRPLKPGLAWLVKKWCNRVIQGGGDGGHDPEEDARGCLELVKMKVERGDGFGTFRVDWESIFERIGRAGGVRSAVVDHGNAGIMHGAKATTAIGCKNDDEIVEGLIGALGAHQFLFGRFLGVADGLGWTTPKKSTDPTSLPELSPPPVPAPQPSKESLLQTLSTQLSTLHASLPPKTALLIFTGHSDPREMAKLNARKAEFEGRVRRGEVGGVDVGSFPSGNGGQTGLSGGVKLGLSSGEMGDANVKGKDKENAGGESVSGAEVRWTAEDARSLEEAVELAKRGLMFLGVK